MTRYRTALLHVSWLAALLVGACATAGDSRSYLLSSLRQAMERPVESQERSLRHSRLVQDVAEADLLMNMSRSEVRDELGRGDACSRHPRCAQEGFGPNDWVYHVGSDGPAEIPMLIVGFDSTGHVTRTWYLKTH